MTHGTHIVHIEDGWLRLLDGLHVFRWFLHVQPWLDDREARTALALQIDLSELASYPPGIRWHLLEARRRGIANVFDLHRLPLVRFLSTPVVCAIGSHCAAGQWPVLDPSWLGRGQADVLPGLDRAALLLDAAGFRPLIELIVMVIIVDQQLGGVEYDMMLPQTIIVPLGLDAYQLGEQLAVQAALHKMRCFLAARNWEGKGQAKHFSPTEMQLVEQAVISGVGIRYASALQLTGLLTENEFAVSMQRASECQVEVEQIASMVYDLVEAFESIRLYDIITTYVPYERQFSRFSNGALPGQ